MLRKSIPEEGISRKRITFPAKVTIAGRFKHKQERRKMAERKTEPGDGYSRREFLKRGENT